MEPAALVTWPVVAMTLIAAIPGILASVAAIMAAMRSAQNAAAIERVHVLVNSQMTAVKDKLEAALTEIATLTGQPKKSAAEAPTSAQAAAGRPGT